MWRGSMQGVPRVNAWCGVAQCRVWRGSSRVWRGSMQVRRVSMQGVAWPNAGCGMTQLGCGVAQCRGRRGSMQGVPWLNTGCGVAQLGFGVAQCLAHRPAVRHTRVPFHPRLSWHKFIYSEKEIYDLPSSGRQDTHQMRYQRDQRGAPADC